MNLEIKFLIIYFFVNGIFLVNLKNFANRIGFIDYSQGKIHNKDTPKFGFFLFGSLIIFISLIYLFKKSNYVFFFNILFLICFFIVGYLDDKYEISVSKRLILSIFITLIFYYFNPNNYYVSNVFPLYLNIYFLCFFTLGFVHLTNITDGINGLVPLLFLYSLIYYLFKGYNSLNDFHLYLLLFSIIGITIYLIPNFIGFCFLGNIGSYLIAVILSMIYMELYIQGIVEYSDILLIFFIPLLDGLRVTINRLINKKNPFLGDFSHMHHAIRGNFIKSIAYFIIVFTPSIFNFFYKDFTIFIAAISFISYLITYKSTY